jgi:hypothetical protein
MANKTGRGDNGLVTGTSDIGHKADIHSARGMSVIEQSGSAKDAGGSRF